MSFFFPPSPSHVVAVSVVFGLNDTMGMRFLADSRQADGRSCVEQQGALSFRRESEDVGELPGGGGSERFE